MAAASLTRGGRKRREPPCGTIVISSRVRLARNMKGVRFPDWCGDEDLVPLARFLGAACISAGRDLGRDLDFYELDGAGDDFGGYLAESGLISQTLLDRPSGAGVVLDSSEEAYSLGRFSAMVNEEDHLRLHCIRPGYDLDGAWKTLDAFDTALSRHVPYAFSPRLGYLTSCPSNVGTGLRASVEVTLPALLLLDEFDAVSRAVSRLRFNVRGENGEGSAISSATIQISTGGTLGLSEAQAIAGLRHVVDEVVRQEALARNYVFAHREDYFLDYFSRALAILQSAYLIATDEARSCLLAVRLGIETGYVGGTKVDAIDKLLPRIGHVTIKRMLREIRGGADGGDGGRDGDEIDNCDAFRASMLSDQLRKAYVRD